MSVIQPKAVIAVLASWLGGDVHAVLEITQRPSAAGASDGVAGTNDPQSDSGAAGADDGVDFRRGLLRWAGRMRWRRALALGRRGLIVGLGAGALAALIVLLAGAGRPLWAVAFLLTAPIAVALTFSRRISEARAAGLLDRSLGLHDTLGTALELQSAGVPATGLGALVMADARADLAHSFSAARLRARPARNEWACAAGLACVLAALIAVPHAGSHSGTSAGGSVSALAPPAASPGTPTTPRTTPGTTTRPSASTTSSGTGSTAAVRQVPLTGGAKAAFGVQANPKPGSHAPIDVNGSATVQGSATKPGLSVSGNTGSGTGTGGTAKATNQKAPAGGGTTTTPAPASKTGQAGPGSGAKATSAKGKGAGSSQKPAAPSRHSSASAGAHGAGQGGTPTGGKAGAAAAAATAKLGLTPYTTGTGKKSLPLQPSYTPSGAGHVSLKHLGSSQSTSGGGVGAGRTGHPGSKTSTSGGGTDFSVIPPSANAPDSSEQDLFQNYFGTTNQLSFKGW